MPEDEVAGMGDRDDVGDVPALFGFTGSLTNFFDSFMCTTTSLPSIFSHAVAASTSRLSPVLLEGFATAGCLDA